MRTEDFRATLHEAAEIEPAAHVVAARDAIAGRVKRQQARRLAAVAAVVVVVLVAAAISFARIGRGSREQDLVTNPSGDIPRLVPGFVPDGFGLFSLIEGPYSEMPVESVHTTIYAKSTQGDPANGNSFALVWFKPAAGSASPNANRSIELTPPDPNKVQTGPDDMRSVGKQDANGWFVGVMTRTLSDDELRGVVAAVTVSPDGTAVNAATIPTGYTPIAHGTDASLITAEPSLMSVSAGGYILAYTNEASRNAQLSTGASGGGHAATFQTIVQKGSVDDLTTLRWQLNDDATVSVHGHDAVTGSMSNGTTSRQDLGTISGDVSSRTTQSTPGTAVSVPNPRAPVIAWMEDDHTLVRVQGTGLDASTLQRIAEGLRPLDETGWTQFKGTTTTTSLGANCVTNTHGGTTCTTSTPGTARAGGSTPIEGSGSGSSGTMVCTTNPGGNGGHCSGQAQALPIDPKTGQPIPPIPQASLTPSTTATSTVPSPNP